MDVKYLDLICTKETFRGSADPSVVPFDAYENYAQITDLYDSCPECQSFPKEEYFSGDWYENWEDYVLWEDGVIAARAGIWKKDAQEWEVAGVITRPEYRGKGYSTRVISDCAARILEAGKTAFLTTAETNHPMLAAARKAGFVLRSSFQIGQEMLAHGGNSEK